MRKILVFVLSLLTIFLVYACNQEQDKEPLPNLDGKKVVMIIASKDFRDEELKEPQSLLEKQGAKVTIASSTTSQVTGMKGMKVTPGILLDQVKVEDYDAVVFIGGSGASEYWDDPKAHSIAKKTVDDDKILGAICIAPVTLANAGVLNGKRATVFSSEKDRLVASGAIYTNADVEVDGKIITANGPGAAEEFGKALVRAIAS